MSEKEMDKRWDTISHRTVEVNGIKMHVAERGEGPVVLFLHGFPDLWYGWRHQIMALSDYGYHAVAPDLRGYGGTIIPDENRRKDVDSYTIFQIIGDILALIDSLKVDKVYLVGHDWGAIIGWYLCMLFPNRIQAYVCLSIPFRFFLVRDPQTKPLEIFEKKYTKDFYICRFQKQDEMERELGHVLRKKLMTSILTSHSDGPAKFPADRYWPGFNPEYKDSDHLPHWFTEEDAQYYAIQFNKSGFTGPLNYFRALDLDWELTSPWNGVGVNQVPVKFITGDKGLFYTLPGIPEYIFDGGFKKDVPSLDPDITLLEGAGHFGLPQEKPEAGLDRFQKNNLPAFCGDYDLEGAENWLREIKKIFHIMQCPEEQQVLFATHMLAEEAEY